LLLAAESIWQAVVIAVLTDFRDKECDGNVYNYFKQPSRNEAAERG